MKLIKTIKRIGSMSFNGSYLVTRGIVENKLMEISIFDINQMNLVYSMEIEAYPNHVFGNNIFFKKGNKYLYYNFINSKLNILHNSYDEKSISFINNSNLHSLSKRYVKSGQSNKYEFFDFDKKIWEMDYKGSLILYSPTIFLLLSKKDGLSNRDEFSKINPNTGEKIWHFNLDDHLDKLVSQYPFKHENKISNLIGEYKNQLWFSMKNGGLLCLDSNSGEFLHYMRDEERNTAPWANSAGRHPILTSSRFAKLLKEEGKLIVFEMYYYWELDLESLKISFHILKDYFEEIGYEGVKGVIPTIKGDQIITIDNRNSKFGAFNRKTLTFDWIEKLPKGMTRPRDIKMFRDKYFILTHNGNLLVYDDSPIV